MKYTTHKLNADGWTDWIMPNAKGYRLKCCDCGLIHVLEFKTAFIKNRGRTTYRARRLVRSTAAARRKK